MCKWKSFSDRMHHKSFGRRAPADPLGELIAFPRLPSWIYYGKGKEGKEEKRRKGKEI